MYMQISLSETWNYVNVSLMASHTVFCYDAFHIEIDPECSELEECGEVEGGASPLQG